MIIFEIIEAEDFIKNNTKECNMDKKVVGYKLIKPEYREVALKISGTVANWENSLANYDISIKQVGYVTKLKNAGVLDLWFTPVYEEEFKVDDWVITKGYTNDYDGKALKITRISEGGYYYFTPNKCITDNFSKSMILRKATPEEIKSLLVNEFLKF